MSDTTTTAAPKNGAPQAIELAAPQGAAPLSVIERTYGLSDAEYAILLKTTCLGAPREMAGFYMIVCKRRRVDPFAKHLYLIKTYDGGSDKWQVVSGIDGLRVIASRNPHYRAQSEPAWEYVLDEAGQPALFRADDSKYGAIAGKRMPLSCKVVVYRAIPSLADRAIEGRDQWLAFTGIARFDEFVKRDRQTKKIQGNWEHQPEHQLRVRAEAMALRMAFPEDVGSIYLEEELTDQGTDTGSSAQGIRQVGPSRAAEVAARMAGRGVTAAATIEQPAQPTVDLSQASEDDRRAYLVALATELRLGEDALAEIEASLPEGPLTDERRAEIADRLYDRAREVIEAAADSDEPPDLASMSEEGLEAYVVDTARAAGLTSTALKIIIRGIADDNLTADNAQAVLDEIARRKAAAAKR